MKRYFIFGILTILIITLNFAFVIVLLAEEAHINYNVLLWMWVAVILSALGLVYLLKEKPLRHGTKRTKSVIYRNKSGVGMKKNEIPEIYSDKAFKKFKILLPPELTPKIQPGFFSGRITTEEYAQEDVQAVYHREGQLLGFVSKKKSRLCYNLAQLYKDPIICWGEINWDDDKMTYKVKGLVPVLFNQGELNRFHKILRLKTELIHLEAAPDPTNKFLYLEKAEKILYLQQSQEPIPAMDYEADHAMVKLLFRRILFSRKTNEILRLKEFPILLNNLSRPLKQEINDAIAMANNRLVS